jgi:OmpA-OmpF porin, OOP family
MRFRPLASCLALAAALHGHPAGAQEQGGFALDRFEPAERGSDWFSQESLDFRGHVRPALGVVADYAYKPLVLYANDGDDEAVAIVRHQMFLHMGGGLILWDRLRLAVSLPVTVWNSGNRGVLDGAFVVDGAEGGGVGDLRLAADLRLVGQYGQPFSLALGTQLHLPTGDQKAFTSDGKVRVTPHLLGAGDIGIFAYAARVQFNFRPQDQNIYGSGYPFGSELGFGASAGVRVLDKKLLLGPELFGATTVSDGGDGIFARKATPLEVIFGGHYTAGDFRFGLGAGPGLSRGIGAPSVRVLASFEYVPAIVKEKPKAEPPSDLDSDGILDDADACVHVAGVSSSDPKKHGCPPPKDSDGDGIVDEQDACPNEKGIASDDPKKHGCPPPKDSDGDGIVDEQDACPNEKGIASDDPKKHGCPPPKDTDTDSIIDEQDACPTEKGVASDDPKKHGCPKARLVGKKIEILERIEFDTGKATIRPESEGILKAVLDIMTEYPSIKKLSVDGHTDNRGARGLNVTLSKNRAAAVVTWLVAKGIDKARLTSRGFGPDKPRDSNATDEGRQNNRRVEFNITEGEAVKTVPANEAGTPPPTPR